MKCSQSKLISLGIFLVSLSVYWYTANPLPSGYADSDELITAGNLLSVAHPPGYGLNILLVFVFQRLLFFLSPAYASNLLAGLFHALSLVFIYQAVKKLLPSQTSLAANILTATGVLLVGFSGLFWLYASVIEVASLGNLLIAIITYLAVSFATNPHPHVYRQILLISLIWGIAIGHLQTIILLGPALLMLLIYKQLPLKTEEITRQIILAITITILGFLLSSSLIIPLNARHQPYSWSYPPGINGFFHMIFRQDYNGTFLDRNTSVSNPYFAGLNIPELIVKIPIYLQTIWNQLAGLPTLIILLGIYFTAKHTSRPVAIYLFFSYFIAGLLFGSHTTISSYDPQDLKYRLYVGTSHRQYLLGYTFLAIFSSLGLYYVGKTVRRLITQPYYSPTVILLSLSLVASVILANFSMANQRANSLVYDYATHMLENAEPNALIICSSDFSCFSLFYQTLVENKRADVIVVGTSTKNRQSFLDQHPELYRYFYPESPTFAAEMIAYNLTKRPVYFIDLTQFYIDYIGLDGNPFYVIPHDYLTQITLEKPTSLLGPDLNDPILTKLFHTQIDNRDFHLLGFIDYLASYYQIMARYLTQFNQPSQAATALDIALYLNPNDTRVLNWRQNIYALAHNFSQSLNTSTSSAEYLQLAYQFHQQNQLYEAESAARKSHYLNPDNPEPLKFLLDLYTQYNYPLFAHWTSEHLKVLSYDRL